MSEFSREGCKTPRDIVTDAMRRASWALVQHQLRLEGVQTLTRSQLDLRYVTATFLACREACTSVLGELAQYPVLFPNMAIIRAEASDTAPFKRKVYTQGHEYFIVHAIDGWYAGSPANHTQVGESPLRQLYAAANPQQLLTGIQDREGGDWVDGGYVEGAFAMDAFETEYYVNDNGVSKLRYLEITMTHDEGPVTYIREAELYTVDPDFMPQYYTAV